MANVTALVTCRMRLSVKSVAAVREEAKSQVMLRMKVCLRIWKNLELRNTKMVWKLWAGRIQVRSESRSPGTFPTRTTRLQTKTMVTAKLH